MDRLSVGLGRPPVQANQDQAQETTSRAEEVMPSTEERGSDVEPNRATRSAGRGGRGGEFDVRGRSTARGSEVEDEEGTKAASLHQSSNPDVTLGTTRDRALLGLPPGWGMRRDQDGRTSFVDHIFNKTTHVRPSRHIPLPAGWERRWKIGGRPYFFDHHTGTATLTNPAPRDDPHWIERLTEDGKRYFVNERTKTATWIDPNFRTRHAMMRLDMQHVPEPHSCTHCDRIIVNFYEEEPSRRQSPPNSAWVLCAESTEDVAAAQRDGCPLFRYLFGYPQTTRSDINKLRQEDLFLRVRCSRIETFEDRLSFVAKNWVLGPRYFLYHAKETIGDESWKERPPAKNTPKFMLCRDDYSSGCYSISSSRQ